MSRSERRKRRQRRRMGFRLLKVYAEGAREAHPNLNREQLANRIKADLELEFEGQPILAMLLELFENFISLLLDGLFDD